IFHCWVVPASLTVNENVAVPVFVGFAGVLVIVTVGAVVSIVQVNVVLAPVLPAASVAWTENVCEPSARPANVFGDVHAANAPASSLHCCVVPDSLTVNANVALAELLGFDGVEVSVTVGGTVSIVHVKLALPVLPAVSVERTVNVWFPSARLVNVLGDAHATNAPASTLHWIVPSLTVNANVAVDVLLGFAGVLVIVTVGACVSIVHVKLSLPTLP